MRSKTKPSGSFIETARRAQIIDTAIEVIAELGYGQASLAAIAQRAGISKSVISYHFADKADLVEQIVAHVYGQTWAFVEPRLNAQPTASGQIRAFIESEMAYLAAHRTQLLAAGDIVVSHRTDDGSPHFTIGIEDSVLDLLVGILRTGQEAGEFRDFDPTVVAVTLSQAIDGALGRWAADPDIDLAAYGRELITLFDHAIRR